MDPTLVVYIGEPMLITCPVRKGAGHLKTLAVRWTGKSFEMSGQLRCVCCADPPLVVRILQPRADGGAGAEEAWVVA